MKNTGVLQKMQKFLWCGGNGTVISILNSNQLHLSHFNFWENSNLNMRKLHFGSINFYDTELCIFWKVKTKLGHVLGQILNIYIFRNIIKIIYTYNICINLLSLWIGAKSVFLCFTFVTVSALKGIHGSVLWPFGGDSLSVRVSVGSRYSTLFSCNTFVKVDHLKSIF